MSIKWRIGLGVTVVLVAAIVAISAVAYEETKESLRKHQDETLRGLAGGIEFEMSRSETLKEVQNHVRAVLGTGERPGSTQYRVWREKAGGEEELARSPLASDALWEEMSRKRKRPETGKMTFLNTSGSGQEYRAGWLRFETPDGVANVFIAMSRSNVQHEMGEFLGCMVIPGAGIARGAGIATGLVVYWGMRPVGATAERLKRVSVSNLGNRHLDDQKVPKELTPFRDALGEMLARLDKGMKQQKQFTADASHELRTPLTLVKSTLEAARFEGEGKSELEGAVSEALEDIGRMERLLEQLLTLARLDEQAEEAGQDAVTLSEVLDEVGAMYEGRARDAGGEVIVTVEDGLRVLGRAEDLKRMFGNLVDNAIQHGPRGGRVKVEAKRTEPGRCEVTVHDEGGGIAKEDLERLFERFYRADASRTRKTGGAGLGLSIAQEIALRHGGTVEMTSSPDAGTTVTVRLSAL